MGKRNRSESVGAILAAALGGLGAACAGGALVRMGVRPSVAAACVGTVGALAAAMLDGRARDAALGASAVGAGQLVLAWLEAEARAGAIEETRSRALFDVAEVVEVVGDDDEEELVEPEEGIPGEDESNDDDGLVIELAMPRNGAPETFWDRLRSPSSQVWWATGMVALPLLLLAWL